jgi:hypothetical protein
LRVEVVVVMAARTRGGSGVLCSDLCVRSMHWNQKGFKSPVNRTNIEEQKELLAMRSTTRGQLREGDRPWGGRLWETCQAMNKKSMGGRPDGVRWHNTPKPRRSVREVNGTLGRGRFQCLPAEISPACGPLRRAARPPAMAVVTGEKSAEVIVVGQTSRSAGKRSKVAGWTHPTKDRTNDGTPTRGAHPPRRTRTGE